MQVFDKELLKDNKKVVFFLVLFLGLFIAIDCGKENILAFFNVSKNTSDKLIINEIMVSNQGVFADTYGDCYDWIELYNGTDEDISLFNYTLTDNEYGNNLWVFPDITIKSHEYQLVYLTGLIMEEKEGLYVPFALNKDGGEVLTLKDSKGKVIENIPIPKIKTNVAMARNEKGEFENSKMITPGFPNTEEGRKQYLESLEGDSTNLVITEFLPNNKGIYFHDGDLYPYIEIENRSEDKISLKDYYLSDDYDRPFLWRLEDIELKPGEIYLVYATGLGKENYTNFSIDKQEGELLLSYKDKIVDRVSYKIETPGYAFVKENDTFIETTDITPGFPNTISGKKEYAQSMKYSNDLIISEIINGNYSSLKQKDGKYYDWIELYNHSDKPIDLSNYQISTSKNNKNGVTLPKKILNPGEYYVYIASNSAVFNITDDQSFYLYKGEEIVDALYLGQTPVGYSYGKNLSGGYYYYNTPTPALKNTGGNMQISATPTFSENPGIYQDIDKLLIELNGKGNIYYTLDGSIPNKNSTLYTKPIVLSKTTVIKMISYEDGKIASNVESGSYIINENHSLPVMSISLPASSFQKIINNPESRGLIVKAHAELYEESNSFSVDCGFKIFGGESRNLDKKSFSLKFASEYGTASLKYPVFSNRTIEKYDNLVLRSGSQDMMTAMMRDELGTSIMVDYGSVDAQSYKPVILYINGSYWGIYYIREKINDNFIEQHYNVSKENTNIVRIEGRIDEGNSKDYQSLLQYVKTHDLSITEHYNYVKTKLDVDNYIEFLIGQFYTNNFDIRNTRYFNNPSIDNNRIKLIFYDLDYGFRPYPTNFLTWLLDPNGAGYFNVDNSLIRGLMDNKEFQERFLDLFFYNLKYVWTEEHLLTRYNEIYNAIEPEMRRNQERWGYSYDEWKKNCEEIKKFIQGRETSLLRQVKSYFRLTDAEIEARMRTNHRLKDIFSHNQNLF